MKKQQNGTPRQIMCRGVMHTFYAHYTQKSVWIIVDNFLPLWKRTNVCGQFCVFWTKFHEFLLIIIHIFPFQRNFRQVIHKILFPKSCQQTRLWRSYPPKNPLFCPYNRATPLKWKLVHSDRDKVIHIFKNRVWITLTYPHFSGKPSFSRCIQPFIIVCFDNLCRNSTAFIHP